jgi:hypothetical protein
MRSILLIAACIAIVILVLKKYSIQSSKDKSSATVKTVENKTAFPLLKEEVKLWAGYNY